MKTLGSTDPVDPWLSSLATLLGFLIYLPPLYFPARTAMFTYPRHWKQMKNRILGLPPSLSLRTAISFLQSPYAPYTHTFRTYWLSGGLWIGKKIARFPRAKQVSMQASSLQSRCNKRHFTFPKAFDRCGRLRLPQRSCLPTLKGKCYYVSKATPC